MTTRRESRTHAIWRVLDAATGRLTAEQIHAALNDGKALDSVYATLAAMARRGNVTRHRDGRRRGPARPVLWSAGREPGFSAQENNRTVRVRIVTLRAALAGDAEARAAVEREIGGGA